MQNIIIADTSCLIILHKIGHLNLLKDVFKTIYVTDIIAKEFGAELPEWIIIANPTNLDFQIILNASVDLGEASAIALAFEQKDALIILDDLKGRKLASSLNLLFTGTFGFIMIAKSAGKLASVKTIIDKIKLTNFHITPELEEKILKTAGEI
jgi:predicted nucleic acid-binding protein